jgi:hypothetical protein
MFLVLSNSILSVERKTERQTEREGAWVDRSARLISATCIVVPLITPMALGKHLTLRRSANGEVKTS